LSAISASRDEREVREAVEAIVRAFSDGRVDDYFSFFHPDCSFVFYTNERRLNSPVEYRSLWERWVAEDGFEVRSCLTRDKRVQLWGDSAVVTHEVETHVSTHSSEDVLFEHETIVLVRAADGRWLAVHEHLSPAKR